MNLEPVFPEHAVSGTEASPAEGVLMGRGGERCAKCGEVTSRGFQRCAQSTAVPFTPDNHLVVLRSHIPSASDRWRVHGGLPQLRSPHNYRKVEPGKGPDNLSLDTKLCS